ncbi:MAG: protease-like activity factor CPAF [Chlamydiales bacterium]
MKIFFSCFLIRLLCIGTSFAAIPSNQSSLTKKRVLADLDSIHTIFSVKYAPLKWKEESTTWRLDQAIQEAKNKIENQSYPTLKECQVVIRDFFNSVCDYHTHVEFYSTESASLPFLIKGANQRYFICEIDSDKISKKQFPFAVGDEILTFDGEPIDKVVEDLRKTEFGSNTYSTDLALATMLLTNRHGSLGNKIPKGNVIVTGRHKRNNKIISANLRWNYIPEKICDFSKITALKTDLQTNVRFLNHPSIFHTPLKQNSFLRKFMVFPQWTYLHPNHRTLNKHQIGARSSYLPSIGKKIWESEQDSPFDAYIFETPIGKTIGYIRIPHYMGEIEEVSYFGEIINYFQTETDGLIIDQLDNPGGSVLYLYALASILTDKPLNTPKHHISLTQAEVETALSTLSYLEDCKDEETTNLILGDEAEGYPMSYLFVVLMRKFYQFLIDQWNRGKLYTDLTHVFGVDQIMPHPEYRYTKPILVLINSLDFSGGDFFPAILQDNKRATLMGTRTAGAGGYLMTATFPNQSGIKEFMMTGSLARRMNKDVIENKGVNPDILYELTPEDLQEDYHCYIDAIMQTISSLVK